MAISFGGLGNGVDFGQVVTELAKVQRVPIDALNTKKNSLQTKLTDYGTLGMKLLALQSAANALRLPNSFDRTATTVSDETKLTAQAGALEFLAARLQTMAPDAYAKKEEFNAMFKALEKSVADLKAALSTNDATKVKQALSKMKPPYAKMFLKFG